MNESEIERELSLVEIKAVEFRKILRDGIGDIKELGRGEALAWIGIVNEVLEDLIDYIENVNTYK